MLPHFIMAQAMRKIVRDGGYNVVHHVARADEHSRVVVRPSPDLLYSICPFDLSKGDLRVQAEVPPGTYWSVSVFDADTNNIFVENDRQAKGRDFWQSADPISFDSRVKSTSERPKPQTKLYRVFATAARRNQIPPTARGLVLFRTLINDESHFARSMQPGGRRRAGCTIRRADLS